MLFRKLPLIILLLAGLFAFQGPVESSRLPQVAQTELVIRARSNHWRAFQTRASGCPVPSEAIDYFVYNETIPALLHQQVFYQSLLVDYQHHQSTL